MDITPITIVISNYTGYILFKAHYLTSFYINRYIILIFIFYRCGTYNNLNSGTVDIYGINYYAPPLIIEKINKHKTTVEWLNESKKYNVFYILGI